MPKFKFVLSPLLFDLFEARGDLRLKSTRPSQSCQQTMVESERGNRMLAIAPNVFDQIISRSVSPTTNETPTKLFDIFCLLKTFLL